MTPTFRVGSALLGTAVVTSVLVLGYGPLVSSLRQLRVACLSDGGQLSAASCSILVRYPNRVPALIALVVVAGLAVLGVVVTRWCLRPFASLVDVVGRLGPTNLGYRLGWRRRRDLLGRLGNGLDAMMDRIGAGYESQRRFAANASHELRTPLAVQRTLIEVSLAEPLTGDQLDLLTTQLLAANRRNERLVEGLLVLAEAEQAPIHHTPQRLDEIVARVVDAYQERASEAGVTLTSQGAPTTVDGEQVLLERLVTNLIQNALAYNLPSGGRVEVRVEPRLVSVVNTGPVVPSEDVDALFEPFRRGLGERLDQSGGAGLGLTIVRAVAAVHRATVTARPGPDGGLAVQVDFPAARSGVVTSS